MVKSMMNSGNRKWKKTNGPEIVAPQGRNFWYAQVEYIIYLFINIHIMIIVSIMLIAVAMVEKLGKSITDIKGLKLLREDQMISIVILFSTDVIEPFEARPLDLFDPVSY